MLLVFFFQVSFNKCSNLTNHTRLPPEKKSAKYCKKVEKIEEKRLKLKT